MTVGEIALLCGLLLNAVAVAYAGWVSKSHLQLVLKDVQKVEVATNGMKDDLIAATKEAAYLAGYVEAKKDLSIPSSDGMTT